MIIGIIGESTLDLIPSPDGSLYFDVMCLFFTIMVLVLQSDSVLIFIHGLEEYPWTQHEPLDKYHYLGSIHFLTSNRLIILNISISLTINRIE